MRQVKLTKIYVYPYAGWADRLWAADPALDAWGRAAAAVAERYGEGLRELARAGRPLRLWTSELQVSAEEAGRLSGAEDVLWWPDEWHVKVLAPASLLAMDSRGRAEASLQVFETVMSTFGEVQGWDPDVLADVSARVRAADYGCSAPPRARRHQAGACGRARSSASVPRGWAGLG